MPEQTIAILALIVNAILVFATIGGGAFAYFVYKNQKKDFKRDAAGIILAEIRHAEELIDKVRDDIQIDFLTILPPANNWEKYSYLFVKDLDQDEIRLINNFYAQCSFIDKAISHVSVLKALEQKSAAIQSTLALIAKEAKDASDYKEERDKFISLFNPEKFVFTPRIATEQLEKALKNVTYITTSTAGEKLKRIAD